MKFKKELTLIEIEYLKSTDNFMAGTDEVGRGPLAGPVVAASAFAYGNMEHLEDSLNQLRALGITDSKKLTDKKRKDILTQLEIDFNNEKSWNLKIGKIRYILSVDEKSPTKIDQINILQASLLSMKDAFVSSLEKVERKINRGVVLIDGNKEFDLKLEKTRLQSVVKGDSKSALIGLASILAKVYRDELMSRLAKKYPHYDFEKNAGYPTQRHRDAISVHGITPAHRRSFKGVKEFVTKSNQ